MQNAKDTFYEVLRGRIAALNPARTVVVRGLTRVGVIVEENELLSAAPPSDCFRLRWTEMKVNVDGAMPRVAMSCVVHYETAGTAAHAGLDRGRALAAMDAELQATLGESPQNAAKKNYAALGSGGAAVAMGTNIWWGSPVFAEAKEAGQTLTRVATVIVMSVEEAGEL